MRDRILHEFPQDAPHKTEEEQDVYYGKEINPKLLSKLQAHLDPSPKSKEEIVQDIRDVVYTMHSVASADPEVLNGSQATLDDDLHRVFNDRLPDPAQEDPPPEDNPTSKTDARLKELRRAFANTLADTQNHLSKMEEKIGTSLDTSKLSTAKALALSSPENFMSTYMKSLAQRATNKAKTKSANKSKRNKKK